MTNRTAPSVDGAFLPTGTNNNTTFNGLFFHVSRGFTMTKAKMDSQRLETSKTDSTNISIIAAYIYDALYDTLS